MQVLLAWYRRHATAIWLAGAVLLGLVQAVDYRYSVNPDGIAYLDMGDAYLRGDWTTAIRSHWSPLYACLLAAALRLVQPSPGLEFPLVHLVNFGIYCSALGTFTFLLHEIIVTMRDAELRAPAHIGLSRCAWTSVGFAAFLWCTLRNTPLSLLTPDLLVSAVVYGIGGLVLRTQRRPTRWCSALLGGLLGLGYLAKAPMLPLALVFLASSVPLVSGWSRRVSHLVATAAALAITVLPFVVTLSAANGRLTIGDSAALNYLWMIDGAPMVHWQGGPDGLGQPVHHSQLVLERPAIFAFESPFAVSYAAWYAPEYWFEGAKPVFTLDGHLQAIAASVKAYASQAVDLGVIFAAVAILLSMHSRPWHIRWSPAVALLVPALAALSMYTLVLVEGRYVAPFLLLVILGLLMSVRLPRAPWSTALAANVSVVMVIVLLLQIGWTSSGDARSLLAQVLHGRLLEADEQTLVASALHSAGIKPGDAVATGNRAFNDYWARLARVRIIAEVSDPDGPAILDADPAARTAAQQVLLAQPVRAVVAHSWPAQTDDPGWLPIEGTDYFYYLVPSR